MTSHALADKLTALIVTDAQNAAATIVDHGRSIDEAVKSVNAAFDAADAEAKRNHDTLIDFLQRQAAAEAEVRRMLRNSVNGILRDLITRGDDLAAQIRAGLPVSPQPVDPVPALTAADAVFMLTVEDDGDAAAEARMVPRYVQSAEKIADVEIAA